MIEKNIENAYHDGQVMNYHDIHLGLLGHSLNYASAVIDSFRFYKTPDGTYAIGLDLYIQRFLESVAYREYELEESKEKIIKILQVLLFKNRHLEHPYARMIAYIGDDSTNITEPKVHFGITIFDLLVPNRPLKAQYSSFLRKKEYSNALKLSSNYSKNIVEQMKLKKQGFDIPIFLGEENEILECVSENIFYVKNNKVFTPNIGNIVNGINRKILFSLLPKHNIYIEEKEISMDEISEADEIFITGTATGIRSICALGHHQIGDGKNYQLTNRIKKIFNNEIFGYTELGNIIIAKIL